MTASEAHAALRAALEAARTAGRADVLLEEYPSPAMRAKADDVDAAAEAAAALAHAALSEIICPTS